MDGTLHIVTLDQKPCVVNYLEHYNKFLVGTYELFPSVEDARHKLSSQQDDNHLKKNLEDINFRAGQLILLRGNDLSVPCIEYEFDCIDGGGVFDAKVSYNELDSSYNIYVAHSNGTVGVYRLTLQCGNKICLREHIKVSGSNMLTCLDIFSNHDHLNEKKVSQEGYQINPTLTMEKSSQRGTPEVGECGSSSSLRLRLVTGDSKGFITVITNEDPTRLEVAKGDPVWQVRSLRLAHDKYVLIVCSENCSWSIYIIDRQAKSFIMLYKNESKDFSAGVTSIHIRDVTHLAEYDLIELMLGSYDEALQTYHVKINRNGISKPDVCHKNTLAIENGGIWRVKPLKDNKNQLCIAAMYAGSYLLTFGPQGETLSKVIDIESLKLAQKPLHYDIDVSSDNTTFCMVDFNNNLCIFKTIDL